MPLNNEDHKEIQRMVNRMIAQSVGEYFVQGKVIKNDPKRKLVWLKEFGDTPIPCIAFDVQVKYYYTEPHGNTTAVGTAVNSRVATRKTKAYSPEVEILVPRVGDVVLVARHLGSRRLPKCLGVIQSTNYVQAGAS